MKMKDLYEDGKKPEDFFGDYNLEAARADYILCKYHVISGMDTKENLQRLAQKLIVEQNECIIRLLKSQVKGV